MNGFRSAGWVLAGALLAGGAHAQGKSGQQVYETTCQACHATKFDKAPQLGDRKAWAPLLKEGQAVVTAHAFLGIRNMPPKGGNNELSLEEFARAAAYMARQAGGDWKDPDARMLERIRRETEHHRHSDHGK